MDSSRSSSSSSVQHPISIRATIRAGLRRIRTSLTRRNTNSPQSHSSISNSGSDWSDSSRTALVLVNSRPVVSGRHLSRFAATHSENADSDEPSSNGSARRNGLELTFQLPLHSPPALPFQRTPPPSYYESESSNASSIETAQGFREVLIGAESSRRLMRDFPMFLHLNHSPPPVRTSQAPSQPRRYVEEDEDGDSIVAPQPIRHWHRHVDLPAADAELVQDGSGGWRSPPLREVSFSPASLTSGLDLPFGLPER